MIESKYLKDDVKNIQKLLTVPTLKKLETEHLGKLITLSKIRQYEDGERIITEGDTDPWLYFLLAGKARIEKEGVSIAVLEKEGDFFGEMRILDNKSRSASVYAQGKTVCLAVNLSPQKGIDVKSERQADYEFLLKLYRIFTEYMSARLRLANQELIEAKKQAGIEA